MFQRQQVRFQASYTFVIANADVRNCNLAIMNFALSLGGALFIAVGQNIFTNRLSTNLATTVPILYVHLGAVLPHTSSLE